MSSVYYNLFMDSYIKNLTIGRNIAKIRKRRGFTQIELAEKLNINRDLLASYELDRIKISGNLILKISEFFNISTDVLFNHKKDKDNINLDNINIRWIKRLKLIQKLPTEEQRKIQIYINDLLEKNNIKEIN